MSHAHDIAQRARNARALQRVGELAQLVERVAELAPRVVVEIGTCHGGTLHAWCECAADGALIVSIDLPDGEFGGGYAPGDTPKLLGFAKRGQSVKLLRGDSHESRIRTALVNVLNGRMIDFLFIDGDHTYEGVAQDFADYSPLVRPGGLIAFHDVVPHPGDVRVEVHRFWDNLRASELFATKMIRTHGDYEGCGIGTLVWPG